MSRNNILLSITLSTSFVQMFQQLSGNQQAPAQPPPVPVPAAVTPVITPLVSSFGGAPLLPVPIPFSLPLPEHPYEQNDMLADDDSGFDTDDLLDDDDDLEEEEIMQTYPSMQPPSVQSSLLPSLMVPRITHSRQMRKYSAIIVSPYPTRTVRSNSRNTTTIYKPTPLLRGVRRHSSI